MAVQIQNVVTVTSSWSPKQIWRPATEVCDDVVFCKVEKWSREFTRFATGRALDLRKDKSWTVQREFLQSLFDQRQEESKKAVQEVLEGGPSKKRKISQSDKELASPWVQVVMPEVRTEEKVYPERSVRVRWAVKDPALWIEMNPTILEHLAQGIMCGKDHDDGNEGNEH